MKDEVQKYKQSLTASEILLPHLGVIWEFYVTHGICKSAGQKRTVSDYNIKQLPLSQMLKTAEIASEKIKVLPANSINKTLENLDLTTVAGTKAGKHSIKIDLDSPRIACLTPYSIADEDPPEPNVGAAESILTHIRNALAHGNTYLFPNGNMMLEDIAIDGRTITARMILHQKTLLEWIQVIDKDSIYYHFEKEGEVE